MAKLRELLIDVRTNTAKFSQGMDKIETRLSKTAKLARGVGGTFAGAFAIGGITSATREAVNHADAIAKNSRAVGLLAEEYQELSFAARRSGVQQSTFNSSMTAFVKRVGEAKQGVGPLAGFLKKYDQQLLHNIQSSKNQKEALDLVFSAMNKAKSETEKAALANAAFSRSGVKMALMAQDYKALSAEARKLGVVLGNDLVKSAESASDKMENFSSKSKKEMTELALTLSPIVSGFDKLSASAIAATNNTLKYYMGGVSGIKDMVSNGIDAGADSSIANMQSRMAELVRQIQDDKKKIAEASDFGKSAFEEQLSRHLSELKRLHGKFQKQIEKTADSAGKRTSSALDGAAGDVDSVASAVSRLNKLVGGKAVGEWKKLKDSIAAVKDEFKSLTEGGNEPLNKFGQISASLDARQEFGAANKAFSSGNFEEAMKHAEKAKDLLNQIKQAGGTIDSELAANVSSIGLKSIEHVEKLATAAIDFDQAKSEENATKILSRLEEVAAQKPIKAKIKMEMVDGVPTFSHEQIPAPVANKPVAAAIDFDPAMSEESANDALSRLQKVVAENPVKAPIKMEMVDGVPTFSREQVAEAAKSAAGKLEVIASGKVQFDESSIKDQTKAAIEWAKAEAEKSPVIIPVKLAQPGGGDITDNLAEHALKAGGA